MFTTFFAWLRRRTAESVLAGVNDAARQLEDEKAENPAALLLWRRGEEQATEEEPKARKIKAS